MSARRDTRESIQNNGEAKLMEKLGWLKHISQRNTFPPQLPPCSVAKQHSSHSAGMARQLSSHSSCLGLQHSSLLAQQYPHTAVPVAVLGCTRHVAAVEGGDGTRRIGLHTTQGQRGAQRGEQRERGAQRGEQRGEPREKQRGGQRGGRAPRRTGTRLHPTRTGTRAFGNGNGNGAGTARHRHGAA